MWTLLAYLKEVPNWVELRNKLVKTPESLKGKRFGYALDGQKDLSYGKRSCGSHIAWRANWLANKHIAKLSASSCLEKNKDEVASGRTNEHAAYAQNQGSSDMAWATHMKVQILQDIIVQQTLWNQHRCQGGSYGTQVLHLETRRGSCKFKEVIDETRFFI